MRLLDRGGTIQVVDRGVPPFPAVLEDRYELVQMASEAAHEVEDFFEWYRHQCDLRKLRYFVTGEDRVQLRRLRSRHEMLEIRKLAVAFFENADEQLRAGYPHHFRLLTHMEPELVAYVESIVPSKVAV